MRAVFWYLVEGGEKVKSREEDSLLCVGRAASGPLSNKIQPDQKRHKKLSKKLHNFFKTKILTGEKGHIQRRTMGVTFP